MLALFEDHSMCCVLPQVPVAPSAFAFGYGGTSWRSVTRGYFSVPPLGARNSDACVLPRARLAGGKKLFSPQLMRWAKNNMSELQVPLAGALKSAMLYAR